MSHVIGDRLDLDTQPAAVDLAVILEVRHDIDNQIRGHRKADPDRTAAGRKDGRVHADDFTCHVKERPARIAAVHRRIGLDEIVKRT